MNRHKLTVMHVLQETELYGRMVRRDSRLVCIQCWRLVRHVAACFEGASYTAAAWAALQDMALGQADHECPVCARYCTRRIPHEHMNKLYAVKNAIHTYRSALQFAQIAVKSHGR